MANDSGLLFSREERVMAKMKGEIDGTVCASIRLYVMSSAEPPFILHSSNFPPTFFLISFIQKVETRCSEGLLFWKKHWIHSLKIKYRTVRAFYKLKWKSLDNRRVCVSVCTYVHVCVCVSSVSWAAALEVKWPVKPYIQLEALLKKRKCEVSNKSSLSLSSLLLYQQQISVFSGRAAL